MKKSQKILIVEDNEGVRFTYEGLLKMGGYENVDLAATGKEGLIKLKESKYELVLLDYMMDDMDGVKILKTIRKSPAIYGKPKIYIVSAFMEDNFDQYTERNGADGYISKMDVMREDLISLVDEALSETV